MYLFTILLTILSFQTSPAANLPIAQVEIVSPRAIYADADLDAAIIGTVRAGDMYPLQAIDAGWGQIAAGWILIHDLTLAPAVVNNGAVMREPLDWKPIAGTQRRLSPDDTIGIAAVFFNHALLYTADGVGWVALDHLEITDPSPDLIDFVQRRAYVKVETAPLDYLPMHRTPLMTYPLGRAVRVLYMDGDRVLVQTDHSFGWGFAADFDILPAIVQRGVMNAGPVNFRLHPVDGRTITVLSYREAVGILGRDATGDWLKLRVRDGLEGWVAADYVNFEGTIDRLPIVTP